MACEIFPCGTRAQELWHRDFNCPIACGMLVFPPGIKPVSLALAGGFLTTEPPRKPLFASLNEKILLSTPSPSQMSINMMVSYSKSQNKKHINGFQNIAIIGNVSVQFSHSVVSNSLRPHGLQQARLAGPSATPRACQTHVCQIGDVIQPSHPLSSHSPSAFNLS